MSTLVENPVAETPSISDPIPPRRQLTFNWDWNGWQLSKWWTQVRQVGELEPTLRDLTDRVLKKRSLALRFRAKSGEPLKTILVEAYALVREAGRRRLRMRHFDSQILGGIALFNGSISEMETGEGKTLTATLPLYIHALRGRGAHLATVNDYLAERDADLVRPLFDLLGLSVGVVLTNSDSDARRRGYAADITYGTAKEFGFDFMRDRLLLRRIGIEHGDYLGGATTATLDTNDERPVQRSPHFVLVDEADSILIDDARTPMIIGSLEDESRKRLLASFTWAAEHAPSFEEEKHYTVEADTKKYELTAAGRLKMRTLPRPGAVREMGWIELYNFIERAIKVHHEFFLDQHYVVRDDEIVIVDESTGRLAEGRKWRDGIHQAVEAKQGVKVTLPTGQAARITVQDMFLRYPHLAGMTGTAWTSRREMKKIYRLRVFPIPTNRPCIRKQLPPRVFGNSEAKWNAIVEEIRELHAIGRPVLVGTRTIEKSELLAAKLTQAGIPHEVLNANEVAREAEIVKFAGERGKVTVATNMAGRGTDIKLGAGVAQLGGLHVICTEVHDSARIDRQLVGRCARQGDPGTARQYMAFDDDIIKNGFGPKYAARIKQWGQKNQGLANRSLGIFKRAQAKVEKKHFRDRAVLLHQEKLRKQMQREMGQDPYLDTPD
jgi:preprotein translocase subunit SecA